ncbi:MAG: type IV pilus biogenesis/stability protein PilW [Dokdonella sp.]
MRLERFFVTLVLGASVALLGACAQSGPTGGVKKETAASKRQDAARVHTELGQQYLRQGKLEIALGDLTKALEFDPNYVDAHTVIAVLYEQIGESAKAEEHYKRAAELKPKGGAELNNYGRFLCKLGRYDESQGYFQRAIADPFYKTPWFALTNSGTCLLKVGKMDEAEVALRAALKESPRDGEVLFQLASVLYAKRDFFNARAFVQRFEAVAQPRPDALMLGRNIELQLGNAQAAREYTHRLLQGFPDSEQAHTLSARDKS